jgi:hypothetical protein
LRALDAPCAAHQLLANPVEVGAHGACMAPDRQVALRQIDWIEAVEHDAAEEGEVVRTEPAPRCGRGAVGFTQF